MGITVDGKVGPVSWQYLFGYYFYPVKGCDCATEINSARAQTLVNNGYTFVGRYLPGSAYPISLNEKNTIVAANLSIVSLFEQNSTSASYFTQTQGSADAGTAIYGAYSMGQPLGTPIYFTVDYDASDADISGCITQYLVAIYQKFAIFNHPYKIGLYGSGAVLEYFKDYTDYLWLAQSPGWRGAKAFSHFCIKQYLDITIGYGAGVISVDPDDGSSDIGSWQ